ncbi:CRISPR-associated helicase, Cas3 family [Paenibacillus sp. OK060]|uniref:CRISPR-associated helicase/endonuclease Cas3 n=1 Tax=Paenibacillus sp. OK060 TaxID=1881034 RepID=UPI0008819CBC|nr:CRISPR-associated helicase/endonuclease Cas3 [Paenibacillus sp. OK060]SDM16741.1 CRISPR-associated helicase, Cas3 family [Paenibacillus sp. OK060]
MTYIAHIRVKDWATQTVVEHLLGVSRGSGRAGAKMDVEHLAALAGLLHDMGKFTDEFKNYIQLAVAQSDQAPRRGSVDHSTAGGRLLHQRYGGPDQKVPNRMTAEWLANCIISHHQGLRDYVSPDRESPYLKRVQDNALPHYEQAKQQFHQHVTTEELDHLFAQAVEEWKNFYRKAKHHGLPLITASLMTKYIFSCLIDADRSNTREFEENEPPAEVPDYKPFFQKCYDALMNHLHKISLNADSTNPIQALRKEMSDQCEQFAFRESGIYSLSIPTGGGKTLASMRYALRHALEHGKQRIIYVVPYTTIIEQNAAEIRRILLGDDDEEGMILEHHSNVVDNQDDERQDDEDGERYDMKRKQLKLARDHWDRPIIFTTMVQFLNTFYAKGTRNVRRLHQLSNAVIVFDEVQSVPVYCISLFNEALNFLHIFGKSSLLLCTATQPALHEVPQKLRLSNDAEIVSDIRNVGDAFRRVDIHDLTSQAPTGWRAEELASFVQEQMDKVDSVLVILNTKSAVSKLYRELNELAWMEAENIRLVHLSTNMCAAHRKEMLAGLIAGLKDGERVICVSTQLIEAGVDISFQCVIRSLAGLDSIAQAAGRCNRHREVPLRDVYIIRSADENLKHLREIKLGAEMTERVLREFGDDPEALGGSLLSAEAMTCYFRYYYHGIGEKVHYPVPKLEQNLFDLINRNAYNIDGYKQKHGHLPELVNKSAIATVEKYFEVITLKATPVIVPYYEIGRELIADLNGQLGPGELSELLRQAQQYTVNVYEHEMKILSKNDEIIPLLNGQAFALRDTAYSKKFGMQLEGNGEWESMVF